MVHNHRDTCFDDEEDPEHKFCKKNYPREFRSETIEGDDSFPKYRRRSPADGGIEVETRDGRVIDNRVIVPHNIWLLKK